MTRARHVTPIHTTRRIERICNLVTTLLERDLARDEVATLLAVTPSGARKYVGDLRAAGVIESARYVGGTKTALGEPVYTLTMTAEKAREYLESLTTSAPARAAKQSKSAMSIASRDPSRRFHIMHDDAPFSIRVSRTPVARDWLVTAFFGAGRHEVRA